MALSGEDRSAAASAQVSVHQDRPGNRSSVRTWIWLGIVLLLLAIAFLPSAINISRYQRRIAQAIGAGIGRPVHMSAVKLRMLPRPGFELSDFVVEEDPAFGAEPMLRSASVVASVRLVSIWRGRLEIARIQFDEPSLNLVRRGDGQWNFGSVLLKASSTPNAPTAQTHLSAAPRFPYVEATNARINFKNGDEKKPFSFLNADLSLWLDNPDEWRLRFEAQPVRTDLDLDLADTGLLRIDGSVRRAATLNLVPVLLHAEWTKAPLGQLSRMIAGRDAGWRGDLEVRADISGTRDKAVLKTQLRATNVHRIEFAPREAMDLDANCQGSYTRQTHSLEGVACTSPVGNGHLLLRGSIRNMQQSPLTRLDLDMQRVPVSAALGLAQSVRQDFAPNLKAVGRIDGGFQYSGEAIGASRLHGDATVSGLELSSPQLEHPLLLPSLQLTSAADANLPVENFPPRKRHGSRKREAAAREAILRSQTAEAALILKPIGLPAGGALPLQMDGSLTRRGYHMHLAGSATVKSLVAYSQALGLLKYTVSPLAPVGAAVLDLDTTGDWLTSIADPDQPHADSSVDGELTLKNARMTTDYLAAPLDLIGAHAVFKGSDVDWDSASLVYGKLHADGSLQYSQSCVIDCTASFKLKFAALDAGAAESTLLGGGRAQFLDELLARLDHRAHPWPALNGTIEAATLTLQQMSLHDAKATIQINGNQVAIQSFDARALGGSMHLAGTVDASGEQPAYAMEVVFARMNTAEIAALFHERWEGWDKSGEGQISGTTNLRLSGYKPEDLASSVRGTFHWDWTQGSVPADLNAAGMGGEGASRFQLWSAEGTIAAGKVNLTSSTITPGVASSDEPKSIVGTISFDRELNLNVTAISNHGGGDKGARQTENAAGISAVITNAITGTLSQPRLQIERPVVAHDQGNSPALTQ